MWVCAQLRSDAQRRYDGERLLLRTGWWKQLLWWRILRLIQLLQFLQLFVRRGAVELQIDRGVAH